MEYNYTLYYPTIEFQDPKWLWSAALIWDKIYRIVPDDYEPKDSKNIKELVSNSNIVSNISPSSYANDATTLFLKKHNEGVWGAAALSGYDFDEDEYVNLHQDKIDVSINSINIARNKAFSEWIKVPKEFASIYMTFLADYIASKNNLALSTDDSAAWCGSNYFSLDGNISENERMAETQLACLTIENVLPIDILSLSAKQIIQLNENRADERKRFFSSLHNLKEQISKCQDSKIIGDIINDYGKEVIKSISEYKKSLLMANTQSWFGIKSVIIPAVVPIINSFYKLPESVMTPLTAAGLGIGVIGSCIDQISKEKALSKGFKYNYLLELRKRRPFYSNQYHNEPAMHYLYHRLLNDELNEFIND